MRRKYFFNDLESILNEFDKFLTNPDFKYQEMNQLKGKSKTEEWEDDMGRWRKTTFVSEDGVFSISNFERVSVDEPMSENQLRVKLKQCIEQENFEEAAIIRDSLKNLEKNKEKLSSLKQELKTCIESENFEKAILLRDEIKKLKS